MSYSRISPCCNSATRVLPVIVISSKPSLPCTTSACSEPSCCNTRDKMPHKSRWNTPISWFFAPAGLVIGPKILKIVRNPNALRTGATWRMAVWWCWANMKPTPHSSICRAMASGDGFSDAPSCSNTSAAPLDEDTERPPCFATCAPAAAATNMDVVEILKVLAPSPPVPTISTKCGSGATGTFTANSRITLAAAAISDTVSTLMRRPTKMPAICSGSTSPRMIWRIKSCISS